ncbi:MAG: hypothetical protein HY043_09250 [Verrucomicrobia bacterium]|nr:hypothetical protein [Verrucomicrobiota bacterium]
MMRSRMFVLSWISCLALWITGCAGYRLGPTSGVAAGSKTVQVNFFRNETPEPRLIEAVGNSLRRTLQQEGTFRLNTHGSGDVVLDGVITEFRREELSFQPKDVITVRDYALHLGVQVKAVERGTDKVLLERLIWGRTTIRAGGDLPSAERQALPLLAEDFAKKVTALLVDGAW